MRRVVESLPRCPARTGAPPRRAVAATSLLPALFLLIAAPAALAHGGAHHAGDGHWWAMWNMDPPTLLSLALISGLYAAGLRRMWRRAGHGRGISRGQAAAFAASIVALVIALISPLDPLSDQLSSVHMVQHMLLMMVAAPLFILGSPLLATLWAMPSRLRVPGLRALRRSGAWRPTRYLLWQPLLLWVIYAFTLWVWHLPALYQAALRVRLVHEVQHVTFFVASCLFWRVLLDPINRRTLVRGAAVLYLFTTSLHATVLGVFMALAPMPWYSDYVGRTQAWNLTPLEDQQFAGLIMWMPACLIYAVAAAALFVIWVKESDPDPAPITGRTVISVGAVQPAQEGIR